MNLVLGLQEETIVNALQQNSTSSTVFPQERSLFPVLCWAC